MKKTLATLLVVALVASLCGVMFVSADSVSIGANTKSGFYIYMQKAHLFTQQMRFLFI